MYARCDGPSLECTEVTCMRDDFINFPYTCTKMYILHDCMYILSPV